MMIWLSLQLLLLIKGAVSVGEAKEKARKCELPGLSMCDAEEVIIPSRRW